MKPYAKAVQARITGQVQGVGFRAWVAAQAELLGVQGFVRNQHDGCVEAVIAGDAAIVDRMVAALHRGPAAARVDRVQVRPWVGADFARFSVLPTA